MQQLCSYSLDELKSWFLKNGDKPFRAKQIFEWVYKKNVLDFEQMTNLSKDLRSKLKTSFQFTSLNLKTTESSEDRQTVKFLFELAEGGLVEAVLIRSFERKTVCVSSQVGCKGGCVFCASGKNGFFKNLTSAEIIEQVLFIESYIKEKVTNIVFMGMGEPLDNLENIVKAVQLFNDPNGLELSQRRISISTVGMIDQIEKLLKYDLKVNLVLSLHAPNQKTREKLIPFAQENDLDALLKTMFKYADISSRDITFEYILIENVNDSEKDALELAYKLQDFSHFSVNLIPYNPIEISVERELKAKDRALILKRPDRDRVDQFKAILEKKKIPVTQRYAKGGDIAASCGQLALKA